jgi:NADP-dependent 3-hydroxy acid dehydrogenase YdfG
MIYKTALVTGGSRGVGAAITRALGARGVSVTATARSAASLAGLVKETGCEALALDLTEPRFAAEALAGREYDILVGNAGMLPSAGPFHELPLEDILATLNVNLAGAMAVARVVLPGMVRRGTGHLLFIGSMFGPNPARNAAAYAASKGGLRAFCRSLRMDLAGTNVRVTEIAPGRIETEFFRDSMGGDMSKIRAALFEEYRALKPEDVGQAVMSALDMPAHANIGVIEITPTDQVLGGVTYAKRTGATS